MVLRHYRIYTFQPKEIEMARTDWTIGVVCLMAVVSALFSFAGIWLALVFFLALLVLFIANGLQKIPNTPPSKGVLTLFGERQEVEVSEGWNFFPLFPFVFGYVLVKVEVVTSTFGPQKVRTPDGAVISTSETVIWKPGIEGKPGSYVAYLNSGGETGVTAILRERVEDRVKTWGTSNQEGPATWKEAQGLRDDAHSVLAKTLLGAPPLTEVDSLIPTSVWMRFLNQPKSPPTAYDMRPENGENGVAWASIDDVTRHWNWNGLQTIFNGYSQAEQEALKESVEQRRSEINSLRSAKAEFEDEELGITILGFSVGEINLEEGSEVAKAAEQEEKERREMEADKMEIDNISNRATKLKQDHPDLTSDQAFQLVQTERGKVAKTIIAVSGAKTDVGGDLLGLAGIGWEILNGLKGRKGKKGKKKGSKDTEEDETVAEEEDEEEEKKSKGE